MQDVLILTPYLAFLAFYIIYTKTTQDRTWAAMTITASNLNGWT